MSKTKNQVTRRRRAHQAVVVAEIPKKARRNMLKNHMIEVMRSQDSVTACAVPMFVEDASVLADALAQNVAERRTDMSQVMV